MPPITLASSSRYRRTLLAQLQIDFDWISPNIDESPRAGETPQQLVARLAEQKAHAVNCDGLVIASDQVACLDQQILTKPGSFANALRQLKQCSGRSVRFYTSLALLNTQSRHLQLAVETTDVHFRQLSDQQLTRYLEHEQPYDCAGSFKVEGLGISLFTKIKGNDPNSLIGLPLIRLVEFLGAEGVQIP